MKKYTFVRKDGKEEEEILVYLKRLMEDNDNYRADYLALKAKTEEQGKKLSVAEERERMKQGEIDRLNGTVKQREAELYMLRLKLERTQLELKHANAFLEASKYLSQRPITIETVVHKHTNDEATKKKVESLEKKIQTLRDKLGNQSVPLSILAEGLKDYAEETGIDKAHDLFLHLNLVLNSVPAWSKSVPELKRFFREYNRKQAEANIVVRGDYVASKFDGPMYDVHGNEEVKLNNK